MSPKKEPASVKTIGSHRVGDVVELTAVRMNDQGVFLDAGRGIPVMIFSFISTR